MIVVLVASLAVLIGLVVALVLMRGDRLSVHAAPATSTMSGGLPPGELSSRDIDDVRFDTVVRGYRMDQVDDVLERVRAELARRDEELRRLRSMAPAGPLRSAGDRLGARAPLASVAPPTVWEDDGDYIDDLGDFPGLRGWGPRADAQDPTGRPGSGEADGPELGRPRTDR